MKLKIYRYAFVLTIALLCLNGCKKKDDIQNPGQMPGDAGGGDTQPGNGNAQEDVEYVLPGENEIAFSHMGYFYSEDIKLEILSGSECTVYYTKDGTDPDKDQKKYKDPIKLSAGSEVEAVCIKAKGFFEDGTETVTIIHTYFIGKNVDSRFDAMVFSITTDPYNLYDYEYGIFVEGKLRADHIRNNPQDKIEPPDPANFNMRGRESEREVFIEILEPDGTGVAAQEAGIRIYGGWSRASLQKSIKMYARKEYDEENNKFRYEFFPTKTAADGNGSKPDSFDRLVLRNCGNDNGFGFIRDELFQTLAAQAGYLDYEAVRPAVMFVNGDYRGMFWLHDNYNDEYFEENYGKYEGNFQIVEGGDTYRIIDEDGGNEQAVWDYEDMYAYSRLDLTDDATYGKLCELLDVENYLRYFALQIYIGNEDWPHNNNKAYRYYPTEGETYREAPFDGKWRFLLHDLDFSFGIYGNGALTDNIQKYVGSSGEAKEPCPLLGQLMKRPDCKEIFIKMTLDLINGAFSSDNLNAVLADMHASRLNELSRMYDKNLIADWVQFDQLEGRMDEIMTYGMRRVEHTLEDYQTYFKPGNIYQVMVQPSEGCKVKINTFVTEGYFTGNYYTDYNTAVSAVLPSGKELDYWLVNGEQVESDELVITPAVLADNKADIICVVK